ncbi:jg10921 [Pararge aegeria aegeria]|uniref:Jg10921 protein n=1 Tax=Pararge aegeria aegeria TaxID=348720 RepID=A0A8S4SEM4_9NEOP|nr:jg10921 [Pararge aegeria aegeria]
MESTPICRCRVLYLGSAVPQQSKDGLQGIQEPLRELYPEKGATTGGIDSWLSVWSNGILLENVDESGSRVSRFFPISSLHYCAAVRRVSVEGAPRFLPLDSPFARAPAPRRPPLFAAVLRRTQGIKVLECHAFICRREAAANALVRCCFHAYADSSYAKRLEAERSPSQLPPDGDEELEVFDGDENHKVWVGEVDRDDASDDIPHPARAPRPRQITRPASVPPPPPPPEEPKKKATSKKSKKKSSASADELYATMPGPVPVMNGRSLGRAPPAWAAAGHPMVLVAHPAATLPHARPATMGHRGRVPAALAPGPFPPVPPLGRGRIQYATVDPRRSKPPPPAMKAAQSMTGLEAVEDAGGIYRKKGHLNERAFSYSIRQEHRSRSHGSLANLKFAAPPEVETGREELKKEREIMQLVAGLQLNSDEVERREVPPHMIRARHGPR